MKTKAMLAAAALALTAAALPFATRAEDKPLELKSDAKSVSTANNKFGVDLFHKLHKDGENTFISPLSIGVCMQLVTTAAEDETRNQLLKAMHAEQLDLGKGNRNLLTEMNSKQQLTLRVANSVWADPSRITLDQVFVQGARENFDAEVRALDFSKESESLKTINGWVKEETEGKIPELLNQISPTTVTYLINAVYFKADWKTQFKKENTKPADFTMADGTKRKADMMSRRDDFRYGVIDGTQVIQLPYGKDGKVSMWVALPAASEGLDKFVGKLSADSFATWNSKASLQDGTFEMPRFTMRFKEELNEALQALGIKDAFNPAVSEFDKLGVSHMEGNPRIWISKVIHEAVIEVNEEGTVAAAATAVAMDSGGSASPPKPFKMRCDRPFFLAITDSTTGAVLFMGTVYKPEKLE